MIVCVWAQCGSLPYQHVFHFMSPLMCVFRCALCWRLNRGCPMRVHTRGYSVASKTLTKAPALLSDGAQRAVNRTFSTCYFVNCLFIGGKDEMASGEGWMRQKCLSPSDGRVVTFLWNSRGVSMPHLQWNSGTSASGDLLLLSFV